MSERLAKMENVDTVRRVDDYLMRADGDMSGSTTADGGRSVQFAGASICGAMSVQWEMSDWLAEGQARHVSADSVSEHELGGHDLCDDQGMGGRRDSNGQFDAQDCEQGMSDDHGMIRLTTNCLTVSD